MRRACTRPMSPGHRQRRIIKWGLMLVRSRLWKIILRLQRVTLADTGASANEREIYWQSIRLRSPHRRRRGRHQPLLRRPVPDRRRCGSPWGHSTHAIRGSRSASKPLQHRSSPHPASCGPSPHRATARRPASGGSGFPDRGRSADRPTGPAPRRAGRSRARHVAEVRLATPLRSYSRAGTEAVPVRVRRAVAPSTRISSAVAMPSENFTATVRLVVGRRALTKIAAAGQRPALQALEQLFDIEAADRAVMTGQRGGAVER